LEPTVSSFVLFDALLNFVQLSISYALMLIFMTFNVWLCLAILLVEATEFVETGPGRGTLQFLQ
ncbi:hypothetical protein ANCDUO_17970, partial [Ancylostoma duodenale]